ncbi:hypothetical protein FRC00_003455 [Tulasnella sp. 408]|nr:hypothetical protein FRC00_003455 [Tulasnella sp. 408]
MDISSLSISQSQIHNAETSLSGHDTPTEAASHLEKALESLQDGLKLLEKNSGTGLYSKNTRPATSGEKFPRLLNILWNRKEQGVTRGTVDQYMGKIIDFARVIRTASDFALVGHVACKAASKQVLLASSQEGNVDATITLNIRRELDRIFDSSAPLIQTALKLRTSIGQADITDDQAIKKGDTEYVKMAFEPLNQLVVGLERLEAVVSGYEAVLTEMRMLLTSHFFHDDILHPNSSVVWPFIEDKFRALNEQVGISSDVTAIVD